MWTNHVLFIHSTADRHSGRFHFLPVMNSAAINPYLILKDGDNSASISGCLFINADHHIILKGSGPAPPNVPWRPRFLLVEPASDGFSIHTHLLLPTYQAPPRVLSAQVS